MSRVAKNPIEIVDGVTVNVTDKLIEVKGKVGEIKFDLPDTISLEVSENIISVKYDEDNQQSVALAGTTRAIVNNMIVGVSQGFEKKLELKGVGYRAKASGKLLELTLGFSHPVKYQLPEEVQVETPSQTEVVLKSHNKQILGQAAFLASFLLTVSSEYLTPLPLYGSGGLNALISAAACPNICLLWLLRTTSVCDGVST